MDATRGYHTKWSCQKERQIPCDSAFYVGSKIWHKWIYLQNRNRLIEKRLVVTKGGRGMEWGFRVMDVGASQSCPTLQPHGLQPTRLHCPRNSPGKNTGVGCHFLLLIRSDQIRPVAQSCPTLCDPMNHSTPGLPVHHQLLEFTQTHVHRVSDAI